MPDWVADTGDPVRATQRKEKKKKKKKKQTMMSWAVHYTGTNPE